MEGAAPAVAGVGSVSSSAAAPSLWWPFLLSCVSGLSTVLGAVLVLLRARLTSSPLSSAHLAFTSGLACSVMVAVSVAQMLLPASLTSPHCIGPLSALSICAVSAAVCAVAIRQAPIDRLLAWMGLASAALLQPVASTPSPPFTPPLTPSSSRHVPLSHGTCPPLSRPSSPLRHSAAGSAVAQSSTATPPFLQRHANSASAEAATQSAEDAALDGDDDSGDSGATASRDEVRLLIPSTAGKPPLAPLSSHPALFRSSSPPLFRSSAVLLSSPPSSLSTLRLGVLSALLLALHNLPEGLAVFVSSFEDQRAGLAMALALSAHNIPEGLIIAVPIYASTRSAWLTVWWCAASGLTEPLGALLAVSVLRPYLSHRLIQQLLSMVAGVMLTVAAVELFPAGRAYKQPRAMQAGLVCGLLLICATSAVTTAMW